MDKGEIPLGFGLALVQDPDAMQKFSKLPEERRRELLRQAHAVSSKREMQALIIGLSAQN